MKRTCLQKSTNTDEQIACEFHPAECLINSDKPEPIINQSF